MERESSLEQKPRVGDGAGCEERDTLELEAGLALLAFAVRRHDVFLLILMLCASSPSLSLAVYSHPLFPPGPDSAPETGEATCESRSGADGLL